MILIWEKLHEIDLISLCPKHVKQLMYNDAMENISFQICNYLCYSHIAVVRYKKIVTRF